jgi:YgiT-type zinc finger domain-containing protein
MKPIARCPICASRKVHRVKGVVQFRSPAGVINVPDIEFDQCSNCGEKFFDHQASQQIDAFIASAKRRPTRRKSA